MRLENQYGSLSILPILIAVVTRNTFPFRHIFMMDYSGMKSSHAAKLWPFHAQLVLGSALRWWACGTTRLFGLHRNPLHPFTDCYCTFPWTAVLRLSPRCLWDLPSVLLFSPEQRQRLARILWLLLQAQRGPQHCRIGTWAYSAIYIGPQHCRRSTWAYSAIYIISQSSYTGNILELIDNRHWTPRNVFCLMDNI